MLRRFSQVACPNLSTEMRWLARVEMHCISWRAGWNDRFTLNRFKKIETLKV